MFTPNDQISNQTNAMQVDDSSALVLVDQNENCAPTKNEYAESIIYNSQILQDDLKSIGVKIKEHEDNIKLLKSQKTKLDGSILDLQIILGNYLSDPTVKKENHHLNEEQTSEQIITDGKSAAGIYCQLKTRYDAQATNLSLVKDVLGIVATLGKVKDDNLNSLLSEYLGAETMLAFVCRTYEGIKSLETYDKEGCINVESGLHGLGASIGRDMDGRFLVFCLESIRPYDGELVADDPNGRLDLLEPRLPDGEHPYGFLGFAVNMIDMDRKNLFSLTVSGHGLRETLFYNLLSRLQVYKTRADMVQALPCITDGAVSLDGGMIRSDGVFSLGNREDAAIRFSKSVESSSPSGKYVETENQIKEMKSQREKLLEDMQRERQLLEYAKRNFDRKKQQFVMFLAQTSSYP